MGKNAKRYDEIEKMTSPANISFSITETVPRYETCKWTHGMLMSNGSLHTNEGGLIMIRWIDQVDIPKSRDLHNLDSPRDEIRLENNGSTRFFQQWIASDNKGFLHSISAKLLK